MRVASLLFFIAAGCTGRGPAEGLLVDIGKSEPERLVRFYLGAIDGHAGDSLMTVDGGRIVVDGNRIESTTGHHTDRNDDGRLDWEELVALVDATYDVGSRFPRTQSDLATTTGYRDSTTSFILDLYGTMTVARRKVFVPWRAMEASLAGVTASDRRVVYPAATTIVGEHWQDDRLVETTAMTKRPDGFWDFYVYDSSGLLADSTTTEPRALKSPVQCAGCHFGTRTFEPEKSFPAAARPGPDGPREFVSALPPVDTRIVNFFDEHRRRSDTVLGIYATLYTALVLDGGSEYFPASGDPQLRLRLEELIFGAPDHSTQ